MIPCPCGATGADADVRWRGTTLRLYSCRPCWTAYVKRIGDGLAGVVEEDAPVVAIDDRQRSIRGHLARRESAIAVIDVVADARRGVTRRVRHHARYVFRDWRFS